MMGMFSCDGTNWKWENDVGYKLDAINQQVILPQVNDAATPILAFGDGDSGFYEIDDDNLGVSINGGYQFRVTQGAIYKEVTGNMYIWINTASSNTVPTYTFYGDIDTGMGRAAADQLSLIAGGVEGIRVGVNYTAFKTGITNHKTDAGAADYNPSALTSDHIITVDTTAAARAVIISTEDRDSGSADEPRMFVIKDIAGNAGVNNITVSLETAGNIDGAATAVINAAYDSITLMIDGTNGFII